MVVTGWWTVSGSLCLKQTLWKAELNSFFLPYFKIFDKHRTVFWVERKDFHTAGSNQLQTCSWLSQWIKLRQCITEWLKVEDMLMSISDYSHSPASFIKFHLPSSSQLWQAWWGQDECDEAHTYQVLSRRQADVLQIHYKLHFLVFYFDA